MATETLESMGQSLIEGNNFSISVSAESREEADDFLTDLQKAERWKCRSRMFLGRLFRNAAR